MTIQVGLFPNRDVPQFTGSPMQLPTNLPPNGAQILGQAAGQATDFASAMVDRVNKTRLDEFGNNLALYDANTAFEFQKRKGKAALEATPDGVGPTQDLLQTRENYVTDQLKSFQNPALQSAAKELAANHGVVLQKKFMEHQFQEQKNYELGVAQDGLTAQTQLMSSDANDPRLVAQHAALMSKFVQDMNPGQEVGSLQQAMVSKSAFGAIRDLVSSQVTVGNSEDGPYSHLFNLLTPDDRAAALKLTKVSDNMSKALLAVRSGWTKEGNASEFADKVAGNDPLLHTAVVEAYRQRSSDAHVAEQRQDEDLYGDFLHRLTSGATDPSMMKVQIESIKSLGATDKVVGRISHMLYQFNKANQEDPATHFGDFAALVTSENFPTLSRNQMLTAATNLGKHWGPAVVGRWEMANQPGARAPIPDTVKNAVAENLKLNMKDKAQAEQLNSALIQASDYLASESKGKGKYATEKPSWSDMYQEVLFRAKPQVVQPGVIFDTKAPLSTMTPDQLKSTLDNITPSDKKLIETHLSAQGISQRTPRILLQARDDINAMKTGAKPAYDALWNRAFPKAAATPAPIEEGM